MHAKKEKRKKNASEHTYLHGLESSIYILPGAYEPPKAARSGQLRRTAFAFTRI